MASTAAGFVERGGRKDCALPCCRPNPDWVEVEEEEEVVEEGEVLLVAPPLPLLLLLLLLPQGRVCTSGFLGIPFAEYVQGEPRVPMSATLGPFLVPLLLLSPPAAPQKCPAGNATS